MSNFSIYKSFAVALMGCAAGCFAAAPQVHLEVVGASAVGAHDWGRALTQVPFASVRMVSGQDSIPSMEVEHSTGSRVYRVRGTINNRNQLRLPRASFAITDTNGLTEWIESLGKNRAVNQQPSPRIAFGLSAEGLVEVTDRLKTTVQSKTAGRSSRRVLNEINGLVGRRVVVDPPARTAISPDVVVEDELSGLSVGTALAAVARPFGLVVVPLRSKGSTRFLVRSFRGAEEHWPIGWPAEGPPRDHVPKLYEFLEVEIANTPLREAIEVLQSRLDVPVLFDHNGMARQQINLDEVQVSFPLNRTYYSRILKTILSQGKLKYELRVDEADRPFLWISPTKR